MKNLMPKILRRPVQLSFSLNGLLINYAALSCRSNLLSTEVLKFFPTSKITRVSTVFPCGRREPKSFEMSSWPTTVGFIRETVSLLLESQKLTLKCERAPAGGLSGINRLLRFAHRQGKSSAKLCGRQRAATLKCSVHSGQLSEFDSSSNVA